jgi:hypothetical protein
LKKIIGFQIVDKDKNIPEEFYSFEVFVSIEDVIRELESLYDKKWLIEPIFEGDIEEPTFI